MTDKSNANRPATAWALPMGVGVLLALYGLALFLMSDGEANPALVLAALVLGVAAFGWGYYVKNRDS